MRRSGLRNVFAVSLTLFGAMGFLCLLLMASADADQHYGRPGDPPGLIQFLGYARVVRQETATDCGPASLKMLLAHHGVHVSLEQLAKAAGQTPVGSSLLGLKQAAEQFGLVAKGWRLSFSELVQSPLPALVKVAGRHFAVVDGVVDGIMVILDPKEGEVHLPVTRFEEVWDQVALIVERRLAEDVRPETERSKVAQGALNRKRTILTNS